MIIKDLWKYYADTLVFRELTATIGANDRIGLVGPNGVGKTTLLKVLSGEESFEQGSINKAKDYMIGALTQETGGQGLDLYSFLTEPFSHLLDLKREMKLAEARLTEEDVYGDPDRLAKAMDIYGRYQHQFESSGGYDYQVQIKTAALGLGFVEEDFSRQIDSFSGGEKIRAQLARLLLSKPDLLLLDEPTNHLDVEGIEWLEGYLANYPKAIVVVSHDRYFLDRVATKIWELGDNRLHIYKGNYSQYLPQRELKMAQLQEEAERQRAEIAKMEAFVQKFKAGTRSRQAKSVEKRIAKMETVETRTDPKKLGFSLKPKQQSGKEVLSFTEITKSFGDKLVLNQTSGSIKRGDRIALIGPNGCGKSTLLKVLIGELNYQGHIKVGVGVDQGYFSQSLEFTTESTVLDEVYEDHRADLGFLRSVLARMLFTGDDVFKQISVLSGGERNRLALAKLLLTRANFLLLDEPTNHLDIYAREGLEKALLDFGGTILFVSHDRYFIQRLATKIWVMENGRIKEFVGDFAAYQETVRDKKAAQKQAVQREQVANKVVKKKDNSLKIQQELEEEIELLEGEKAVIEERLADPRLYQDEEQSKAEVQRYQELTKDLETVYQEWEKLLMDIEDESDGK